MESPVQIPRIPPTPGPRPLSNNLEEIRRMFAAMIWLECPREEKIQDYLLEYDDWELYDAEKSYSKRVYQAAYTGVLRDYCKALCVINIEGIEKYYVVAKRMKGELEELEPYCPCFTCQAWIINPLKYVWCPVCTRCLKAGKGFASSEYIEIARNKRHDPPSKLDRLVQNIPPLVRLEMMGGLVLLIMIIMSAL